MAGLPFNNAFPVLKSHGAFDTNAPSFKDLMFKGEAEDTWIDLCEKVGQFLATTRKNFDTEDLPEVLKSSESIGKQSALGQWIEKINNSWDDSIKSILPAKRTNQATSEGVIAGGKKAAELMGNENLAKFLNLGNLVTKNVQLLSSQPDVVQINFAATELVRGPLGLDAAVFIADVLINYHLQLRLKHTIRYVTSDCAKSFGRALDEKINWSEAERKEYWRQTSFLTGWEIIRRTTEDPVLLELSQQGELYLEDVFDVGVRLVYNRRIEDINFMIAIALMELL